MVAPIVTDHRPIQVRRAQPRDATAIEALYRLLVPGDDNISVSPDRIAALEENPSNHLLVVELEATVCGSAFLTICLDAMYGFQPYGVVENVIVLPTARGSGLGAALMDGVERAARDARCTKLMLLSGAARESAHSFFRHCGFTSDTKNAFVKYRRQFTPPGS